MTDSTDRPTAADIWSVEDRRGWSVDGARRLVRAIVDEATGGGIDFAMVEDAQRMLETVIPIAEQRWGDGDERRLVRLLMGLGPVLAELESGRALEAHDRLVVLDLAARTGLLDGRLRSRSALRLSGRRAT